MNDPLITVLARLVAVSISYPVFAAEGDHTITATVEGSGSVSATALWQGSNDKVGWVTLATLSPAGTGFGTARASTTETYRYWRLNVTALSGTSVTGTVVSETASGTSRSSVAAAAAPLKIVGRHFAFGYLIGAGGSDVGGTARKVLKTVSPVTKLAALLCTHSFATATYGFGESNLYPRNFNIAKVAFEYGNNVAFANRSGRTSFLLDPSAALVKTDDVSIGVPALTQFSVREYMKPILAPTGVGTATAAAGGSLAAQTWYYVVTRTEMGAESGPTAEFSGTTASSNLTMSLTWVDANSATADYYSIYRSSGAGGAKQYIGRSNGPTKRFVDDGYVADATITPPAASSYRHTMVNCSVGDSSNHNNAGGNSSDQSAVTGTFVSTGPLFGFGVTPNVVVGDDTSGKCVLLTADSIGAGAGFTPQTPIPAALKNFFDAAFSDGELNSCNAGRSSCSLAEMVNPSNPGGGRSRISLISYADWTIDAQGTNDLGGLRTGPQLAADKLLLGQICKQRGSKFATTTILPRVTNPTNNALTIADQPAWSREAERVWFNTWVRNGCLVDSSGAPVLTGGIPSPFIQGTIDICARVEVDATNALTLNGGKWKVPTAAVATGSLTGTPTATSLPTDLALVSQEHVSRVIKMTSGAAVGQTACVQSNNTTTLTVYANGVTTQSGVANAGLTTTPAAGDTFQIWEVLTNEGLHPALAGHAAIAVTMREWLLANVINV